MYHLVKGLYLCEAQKNEAEVALTCQKPRYLDARTRRAARGMTILLTDDTAPNEGVLFSPELTT